MKKKHSFFLLEILMGLSFVTLIFITLLNFFTNTNLLKKEIDKVREEIFLQQNVQFRLTQIFSHISFSNDKIFFYTKKLKDEKKKALFFTFQNIVDPDPLFSGEIQGTLFLDEKNHLVLLLEPLQEKDKKHPSRKEILLSDVSSLTFFFFDPSSKKTTYVSEWEEKKVLPPIIKIIVKTKKKTVDFAFFPFLPQPIISYSNPCTS